MADILNCSVYPGRPKETKGKLSVDRGIFLYDSLTIPNCKLIPFTKQTAFERKLPLQFDVVQWYGSNLARMQKSIRSVQMVNMVVPIRYTHYFNGILNHQDFVHTVELLVSMLKKLNAG